jgi:hypothetical protein
VWYDSCSKAKPFNNPAYQMISLNSISIVITVLALGLGACSKENRVEQSPPKSPMERIAEIDVLLAVPPNGSPNDADRRAALRAERDALSGDGARTIQSQQARAEQQVKQQAYAAEQARRDHQRMVDQLKADAERSRVVEQQRLQAQRDQWEREDRLSLRKQNGNYRPEAPAQNVYDVQIDRTRDRDRW